MLLCFGYSDLEQDDFDVDFISGYLDGEKSILFYRGNVEAGDKFWLDINVAKASIKGYKCQLFYDTAYTQRWKYEKDSSVKEIISNINILKSSSQNIPKNIFKQYGSLTSFSMTNQRVGQLSDDNLRGAIVLQTLNLSRNEISELDSNVFSSVGNLKYLDLSFNKITKISSSTFSSLNKIETIILSGNLLTAARLAWMRPTLRNIYLNSNLIRQLVGYMINNNEYQEIHLEYNALQDISLIGSVTVNTFNVSNNLLGNLHGPIKVNAVIVDIRNANISNCYISQSIVEMNANNNSIADILIPISLDEEIDFNITHLYLSCNCLSSFSNISHFRKLVTVDLSHNLIETVFMGVFKDMPNLNFLSLSHNKIIEIDFQRVTNPITVETFNIAYNQLEFFKLNAEFANLKELNLEGNSLQEIDTKMKLMAPNLVKIGLNNNQFSCSYLTTSVMFLRLEGITFVFLENTTSLLESLNKYDDDVLGIGCYNTQIKQNKDLVTIKPALSEDTIEEIVNTNFLNSKMKELETKLLNSFNFKFNQIFNLFNQTESTTEK